MGCHRHRLSLILSQTAHHQLTVNYQNVFLYEASSFRNLITKKSSVYDTLRDLMNGINAETSAVMLITKYF